MSIDVEILIDGSPIEQAKDILESCEIFEKVMKLREANTTLYTNTIETLKKTGIPPTKKLEIQRLSTLWFKLFEDSSVFRTNIMVHQGDINYLHEKELAYTKALEIANALNNYVQNQIVS